jgi:hypothetical protein
MQLIFLLYRPAITSSLAVGQFLNPKVNLFWPGEFCDEKTRLGAENSQYEAETWWFARRKQCYVGLYCTAATKLETKYYKAAVVTTTDDKSDEKCLPVSLR